MTSMSPDAAPIFDAALALPETLRAELAARLLQSLDDDAPGLCVDAEEFENVLVRRRQEMLDGTVETYSAEDTIAAMREALSERRPS